MKIGFSTGSLALSDVRLGLEMVAGTRTCAIELSALREAELVPLIGILDSLDLGQFEYISFHAPSRLIEMSEGKVVELLENGVNREWPIIVHPDVIVDFACWKILGDRLCIENMDKRKPVGRTVSELEPFFQKLPHARFCFDIGHARQVDPTMSEAASILQHFGDRMEQIHMSYVASNSVHEPLNFEAIMAFRRVASLMPANVPVILETPVKRDRIEAEISLAESLVQCFGIPATSRIKVPVA
jgi:hypothetical protein